MSENKILFCTGPIDEITEEIGKFNSKEESKLKLVLS